MSTNPFLKLATSLRGLKGATTIILHLAATVAATVAATLAIPVEAEAARFKGYTKASAAPERMLKEKIERFEETKTEFLILFSNHSAFYRLPKSKLHDAQIRSFLQDRTDTKKVMTAAINPLNAQITTIEDL